MKVFKLIFKNLLRHKLRTILTIVGIAIAVMAYGLLQTLVNAWYVGLDATSPNRIVTRHSVSIIFQLPLSYKDRIASIPGVSQVSYATWFQGVYIDQNNFFARIAIDPDMLKMYPEIQVPPDQWEAFKNERNACIIGIKIAKKFKIKIGDVMPIRGDIYPGNYEFVVRGIYTGRDKSTDETAMYFQWSYLNERLTQGSPERANQVGWYMLKINDATKSAGISAAVDALFRNSAAETKTETEKAFTESFISMSSAVISGMQFISYIIVGIILLVLANTMVMTARERVKEYAVLKTLGFSATHIVGLILGESMTIAILGGIAGLLFIVPILAAIAIPLSNFFPILETTTQTKVLAVVFAILVGVVASIIPIYRALTTRIVDGLRQVG